MRPGTTNQPAGMFASFDAVHALPTSQVEQLLHRGDVAERVWAAWSLGLREGASAVPTLAAAASNTPDAGVRATLVVILAGHGQRDALAVLATEDPDADVRASACRHLAGTSLPRMAWVRELLEGRLRVEEAVPVRIALLELVAAGQLAIDQARLSEALAHPTVRCREQAAEAVFSLWRRDGTMPPGLPRLLGDEDLAIRAKAGATALELLGPARFVALLGETSGLSRDAIARHLREVSRVGATIPWPAAAGLARDVPRIEVEILEILDDWDMASRPWLLDVMARNVWPASRMAQPRLLPLLEILPLSPDEAVDAERVRNRLDDELADDPDEPPMLLDEEDLKAQERWRVATREVRQAVDRALATSRTVLDARRDQN